MDSDHSTDPATFATRVLLAVTGLSPQVVTETLYALAVAQDRRFVPTEVHLVTTAEGAEHARLTLLSDEPGWFARLCRDYGIDGVRFDADCIHVLTRKDSTLLADIRSPEDNERAADLITERIGFFTARSDTAVHVSIAGGRKTMGFYAGYALSLYGRAQDRLSHVLVSAPFETNQEFYYPTPYSRVIFTGGTNSKPLDTQDARVTLADIPFVRLRDGLPEALAAGRASFSRVVAEAQKGLPPLALVLSPGTLRVTAGGETFTLKPAPFAFYWWLAERRQRGLAGVHWSEDSMAQELLEFYGRLVKRDSGEYERLEGALRRGFTPSYFDPRKAHINKSLRAALGRRRAAPYLIARQDRIPGTRYSRYGLTLPPEAIRVEGGAEQGISNHRLSRRCRS